MWSIVTFGITIDANNRNWSRSDGAKGILVPEPGDQYDIEKEIREATTKPDFRADTFMQAVDWILERLDKRD
jgi:hypothetical protein